MDEEYSDFWRIDGQVLDFGLGRWTLFDRSRSASMATKVKRPCHGLQTLPAAMSAIADMLDHMKRKGEYQRPP